MTYFVATIKDFIKKRPAGAESNPVYSFFFETSSRDRKKVYRRALNKAQKDQEAKSLAARSNKPTI